MDKYKKILEEVLKKIEPGKEEIKEIENSTREFLERVKKRISELKFNVKIFVGGSFAKKTLIKKGKYDVDVFLRFGKDFEEKNISEKAREILCGEKISILHGSRDYFEIEANPKLTIEIIPVMEVKKPEDSSNITDLSYSHVKYINKKIKDKKILDEIKIAKAFCYANNCYGAESYIQGFSGYSLELLVYHYRGFIKFLKEMEKIPEGERKIIDIEKDFKNKNEVLLDLNSSKLKSPIILIDPTYKQRNVLAALSEEKFKIFRDSSEKFLKNPDIKIFETKKINFEEVKKNSDKKGFEFISAIATTKKEGRDVAGSKLLKFFRHLKEETSKFFEIKNSGFEYSGGKEGKLFLAVKRKKEILFKGPLIEDEKNFQRFKQVHKKTFVKNGKIYAKEENEQTIKEFLNKWVHKNKNKIKEMYIDRIEFL